MKVTKIVSIFSAIFVLSSCSLFDKFNKKSENKPNEEDNKPAVVTHDDCEHNFHFDKKTKPTESSPGEMVYQCGLCGDFKTITIPKLDDQNYTVTELVANCIHGNGRRYESETYGVYEVTDDVRTPHTGYNEECSVCHELVGEFNFSNLGNASCGGYPRLYQLSDYWGNKWLLGSDNGTIMCRTSDDLGQTWAKSKKVSDMPSYSCANVDFFELPNHDILCSYRAIGNNDAKYSRKLHFSISHDGADTWEDGGDIVDNYALAEYYEKTETQVTSAMTIESRLGFFEPFVGLINNVPTVMYADDFTPGLLKPMGASISANYKTQYLMTQTYDMKTNTWSQERTIIMDGTKAKSPTGSGLAARISRDGMPVFDRMSDGTYVMVFEGTYRDNDYHSLTGGTLSESHPFEIMMSYSKDGKTWENPVEIYTPHNNLSKSSAPYICVTEDDQLVISFQTDEDAVPTYVGDSYSVMKVIVSKPGLSIDKINGDSFYAVTNVNNTPVGSSSLWNGMMIVDDVLYTCSTNNKLRASRIPVYADKSLYNTEIHIDGSAHNIDTSSISNFDCYTSASYNPTFSSSGITLDHSSHCEQKVMINGTNLPSEYQIDFKLSSEATRDVNGGLYLGASNPNNGADLITAVNVNFERAVQSSNWTVNCYRFNQAYIGNIGSGTKAADYVIDCRIVVNNQKLRVMINDLNTTVVDINVDSTYSLTGLLGIRNQGTSKMTISNIVLTY